MEKLLADFHAIMALIKGNLCAIFNLDELETKLDMIKKEIITEYEKNHKIWQGNDGRWRTQFPDASAKSGRKQIAKSTRQKIEDEIIKLYTEQNEKETVKTLRGLFAKWIDYKAKETSEANANKLEWVWNHYYLNEKIIDRCITDIKVTDLKEFLLDMIEKHSLTNRKYKEMKSLLNMLYDYALEQELIQVNVARNIRGISYKKFSETEKKPIEQQVFLGKEKEQIIKLAIEQYKKTKNTAYLGVCLNFALALRIGELVALHTTDFTDNTVTIRRQEIKTYIKINGKRHRNGYKIIGHTKTLTSDRELTLTSLSREIVTMIIHANEQRGFKDNYLFLNANGERMHDFAINNVLRRLNEKINTPQKANHKIRKTCLSTMANSNALTNKEIQEFAGHKDFNTTATYYLFPTDSKKKRQDAYEKAICGNLKTVTKCNQRSLKQKKSGNL